MIGLSKMYSLKLSTIMEINVFERIKKIIDLRGITMRQLLNGIDLTEQSYYRMARENSIKMSTFDKILSFLRVTPVEFYSDNVIDTVQKSKNTSVESVEDLITDYLLTTKDTRKTLIEKDLKMIEGLIKSIRETLAS